mgnify:CR=1 FL=1
MMVMSVLRLTPACAGTTLGRGSRRRRTGAHPRVRGDDSSSHVPMPESAGSPPRARGRRAGGRPEGVPPRLTPACAGTTSRTRRAAPLARGSPPRARGRRGGVGAWGRGLGLTPACAGTTWRTAPPGRSRWAHPRVRGDDASVMPTASTNFGSPPRARGRHRRRQQGVGGERLTPACAGTTSVGTVTGRLQGAHPRVRGDDDGWGMPSYPVDGSPPRARGRPAVGRGARHRHRLTPACAGTTRWSCPRASGCGAHPRVRGDDPCAGTCTVLPCGSPPRARGRRVRLHRRARRQRLTPACAGTTFDFFTPEQIKAGSPPRARGRPCRGCGRPGGPRLTPACAGTTRCAPSTGCTARAHPRVRGDDLWWNAFTDTVIGSPPRARGRQSLRCHDVPSFRLTPACAGTT